MFVTVGFLEGKPFEVFVHMGKVGTDARANAEEVGRLVSLCLRSGVSASDVIGQLTGIHGSQPIWSMGEKVTGIGDAVAKALRRATIRTELKVHRTHRGWHKWMGGLDRPDGHTIDSFAYGLGKEVEHRRRHAHLFMWNERQKMIVDGWASGWVGEARDKFLVSLEAAYDAMVGAFLDGSKWPK
jgi:hypothetical protein|tara:strand:- start:2117 stop:2668 length:552 start_codon:yes stop_codon:yes gene_type:complete